MSKKKKEIPVVKPKLHPRNKHKERYDFQLLTSENPELIPFVIKSFKGDDTIDFANPSAVKTLNKALLKSYYHIGFWDIPDNFLCPPIPGRADYIHHIADLLCRQNYGKIPMGNKITCLDIGVGANCIYPILGHTEYQWEFIGSDINEEALQNAQKIIDNNPNLKEHITLRKQDFPKDIFYNLLKPEDKIDVTLCNPPFHASAKEAEQASIRKESNLQKTKITTPTLNFGGQHNELWCEGGEERFISKMIYESRKFSKTCFWFTTLVSKQSNLKSIYKSLEKANSIDVITTPMGQGNKTSRMVAWTFLTKEEQRDWKNEKGYTTN
jgi:23S rRNA (adenine1618-N6)-methyltransferase